MHRLRRRMHRLRLDGRAFHGLHRCRSDRLLARCGGCHPVQGRGRRHGVLSGIYGEVRLGRHRLRCHQVQRGYVLSGQVPGRPAPRLLLRRRLQRPGGAADPEEDEDRGRHHGLCQADLHEIQVQRRRRRIRGRAAEARDTSGGPCPSGFRPRRPAHLQLRGDPRGLRPQGVLGRRGDVYAQILPLGPGPGGAIPTDGLSPLRPYGRIWQGTR